MVALGYPGPLLRIIFSTFVSLLAEFPDVNFSVLCFLLSFGQVSSDSQSDIRNFEVSGH
jgi:hypothetical protein